MTITGTACGPNRRLLLIAGLVAELGVTHATPAGHIIPCPIKNAIGLCRKTRHPDACGVVRKRSTAGKIHDVFGIDHPHAQGARQSFSVNAIARSRCDLYPRRGDGAFLQSAVAMLNRGWVRRFHLKVRVVDRDAA